MRRVIYFYFLVLISNVGAQHKIQRIIQGDATDIYIAIEGIDNLQVEESNGSSIEMEVLDRNEIGVIESFSCEDKTCLLKVRTVVKETHAINDKIHQFPSAPPSNVTAIVKVPKGKKITIDGAVVDVQSQGYHGNLKVMIDKGNIRLSHIEGIVELDVFSGAVFASITKDTDLDVSTRKGSITMDKKELSSPYKKTQLQQKRLIVRSINANVVLSSKKR